MEYTTPEVTGCKVRRATVWGTTPGATPYLGPDTGPTADDPGGTNATGTRRVQGHPPPEDKTPYGPLPQTIQQLSLHLVTYPPHAVTSPSLTNLGPVARLDLLAHIQYTQISVK